MDSLDTSHTYAYDDLILASTHPKKRAGRKKFKETRHPVFRGVRRRNSDRWVCEVREPTQQKRIWLGTYPTAEMAARAHDVAALALRGQMACLNFADSVWRLPAPASNDPKDIRKTAVEAAEAFRPKEEVSGDWGVSYNGNVVEDGGSSGNVGFEGGDFSMNEALMSPPPSFVGSLEWYEVESEAEVELWSYSL